MKKSIVVYSSISGFTKRYAGWIAEELGTKALALREFNAAAAKPYDTIIYGGNLLAVGINGLKKFKQIICGLENKTIVIFACGASPGRKEDLENVVRRNFTETERPHFPFFYLRSGFDFNKLDPANKILMSFMKMKLSRIKNRTEDEEGMLAAFDKPTDFSKKENIKSLVEFCRSKA
jgi:hypothetical protein